MEDGGVGGCFLHRLSDLEVESTSLVSNGSHAPLRCEKH